MTRDELLAHGESLLESSQRLLDDMDGALRRGAAASGVSEEAAEVDEAGDRLSDAEHSGAPR